MSKPDPGHLTGTIALAGGDPSHAVMIGDSEVDVRTAKAAGIPIILVSFGYATAPLHGLSPDAMIDHFDALAAHAARPPERRRARPFPGLKRLKSAPDQA